MINGPDEEGNWEKSKNMPVWGTSGRGRFKKQIFTKRVKKGWG